MLIIIFKEDKKTPEVAPIPSHPPPKKDGSGEGTATHHHHHQSLFIHEIVLFYMVFLGIVFKTRLKYSKEVLAIMLKMQKLTL